MKNLIAIILMLFVATANATTYYVAANGSDNNNGTSASTPFKSISKLNTLIFKPGDSILFQNGDVFRGQLTIKQSGSSSKSIVITSYGSSSTLPVISGSEYVNAWSLYQGNIYKASFTTNPLAVFQKDKLVLPARYPNTGFLSIDNAKSNKKFYDAALTQSTGYWNGATLNNRMVRWQYGEQKVKSFSNGNITIAPAALYNFTDGWGYYFSNKFEELDTAGEFFYNNTEKQLYLWSSALPANNSIEASVYNHGIFLDGASYITIQNIQFGQQLYGGIVAEYNNNYLTIKNCGFNNIYRRAIQITTGDNITIQNNTIADIYGKGIVAYDCKKITIQENTIKRIGMIAGIATKDDIGYSAMEIEGSIDNGNISNNTLDSIGYLGIRFSKNTLIEKNSIKNFCITTDDGSAIYTWSNNDTINRNGTGCIIRNNIIENGIGNTQATADADYFANGIYMDDASGNATIENNTINNCSAAGVFLHNSINNLVQKNTVFNCGSTAMGLSNDALSATVGSSNIVSSNIFYSLNENTYPLRLTNYKDSNLNYAKYSGNYYCNPYSGFCVYTENLINNSSNVSLYSLSQWKSLNDTAAKASYVSWNPYTITDTTSGNLIVNGNFANNIDGWYCWSPTNSCTSAWGINNKLNKGSLHVQSNDGVAYNTNYFALNSGQTYQLSFSNIGANPGAISVQTMDATKYTALELNKVIAIDSVRKDDKIIFTPTFSTNPARVNFYVNNSAPDYWLDNVRLQKVNALYNDPLLSNFIFINETNTNKTFALTQTLYDLDNNTVSGSITVVPFSSKILLQKTTNTANAIAIEKTVVTKNERAIKLFPNPVKNILFTNAPFNSTFEIIDATGKKVMNAKCNGSINVSKLAKGFYFIRFIDNQNKMISTEKFMKE